MYKKLSDVELVALIVKGDHDAFAEIVAKHTDRFLTLAFRTLHNKDDAEDVVQAAFIKLWQKPQSWNSDKSQFTTWFYRVIINACHDYYRKQKRNIDIDEQLFDRILEPIDSEQITLEQHQFDCQRKRLLEIAISKLPASQKDALNLVVYSELPQKQAAEIMNISLKALESLLVRAKRSMAKTVAELQTKAEPNEIVLRETNK